MSIKLVIPSISSSVIPFSSCLQSCPASGSLPMSQFFASGGQSIRASALASVLPMNIQDWFPLGLTGWISLQSKGLKGLLQHHSSKTSSLQLSAFFMVQISHPYMTTGKTIALIEWTFVGKVMSLLFNVLSRVVVAFLWKEAVDGNVSPCALWCQIAWVQIPALPLISNVISGRELASSSLSFLIYDIHGKTGTFVHFQVNDMMRVECLAVIRKKQRQKEKLPGWKSSANIQIIKRQKVESRLRIWDRMKAAASNNWIPQGCQETFGIISCMFEKIKMNGSGFLAYFTARQEDQTLHCGVEWVL